jgi:hypothetical protein
MTHDNIPRGWLPAGLPVHFEGVKTVPLWFWLQVAMFFEVATLADFLGVSPRRVRYLLALGRISGHKGKGGRWHIAFPLTITPGKRGPDLLRYPVRKLYPAPGNSRTK